MLELALCVAGIYLCFLTWGLMQERVSTTAYYAWNDSDRSGPSFKFTHFIFLNFTQSLLASIVAFVYIRFLRNQTLKQLPTVQLLKQYSLVAFFSTIASPFGYEALKHVDYPTMILAKSCKLLPVILMGVLLHNRRFEWYKYMSVALITLGVAIFTLMHTSPSSSGSSGGGNSKTSSKQKTNSLWGLFLLAINLGIDGVTNSTQDHIFTQFRIGGPEMMLWMNLLSSLFMFIYLSLISPFMNVNYQSDLLSGLSFIQTYPSSLFDILLFGACGALGQTFIFYTLQRFGSLVLVTVNVTRKMFSMLLSVLWFGHELNAAQWSGVGLVFGGILLEAQMSRAAKNSKKQKIVEDETVKIQQNLNESPRIRQRRSKKE
jgi:solute carrier family 35 (UDP-galactose transporter), member B1